MRQDLQPFPEDVAAAPVAAAATTLGDPVQRLDGLVVAAPGGDDQRGPR
ncbi:hypothetical protein O7621_13975 [Solwaraspora sp. WMMD937]|nr:hypothetical protein [Solwaraspora sp. WMMD937]WFE24269.1 hypothetical protein O7621_13975 [Solwaraspora sp. WMMD937]